MSNLNLCKDCKHNSRVYAKEFNLPRYCHAKNKNIKNSPKTCEFREVIREYAD